MSIPSFDAVTGLLPPGEHAAPWNEIQERFGWNIWRRRLLDVLCEGLAVLGECGCKRVWLNGSFVTAKEEPGDFDCVWAPREWTGLDSLYLRPSYSICAITALPRSGDSGRILPECRRGDKRKVVRRLLPNRPKRNVEGNRHNRSHKGDMAMIANDRQYQQTRKQLRELDDLRTSIATGHVGDSGFEDLQAAGIESQMDDLRVELAEYDELSGGGTTRIEASSLAGLADALIKARIARGWTQADLAESLGVAEQQIQRYESSRYTGASLARLCDVATALDATVHETITLRAS